MDKSDKVLNWFATHLDIHWFMYIWIYLSTNSTENLALNLLFRLFMIKNAQSPRIEFEKVEEIQITSVANF